MQQNRQEKISHMLVSAEVPSANTLMVFEAKGIM